MEASSRLRSAAKLSDSVHRQLNMYALAASAAGVGVLAMAKPAESKIVYTSAHQEIGFNEPFLLDVNNDGKADFMFSWINLFVEWDSRGGYLLQLHERFDNRFYGPPWGVLASGGTWPAPLHAGVRVGVPGQRFGASSEMAATTFGDYGRTRHYFGPWENKGKGVKNRYLGFKFVISGKDHYGWARITFRHPLDAILTGYAYEAVANKPIVTGKTKGPDVITVRPASLGHLARGASATSAWRRNESVANH